MGQAKSDLGQKRHFIPRDHPLGLLEEEWYQDDQVGEQELQAYFGHQD